MPHGEVGPVILVTMTRNAKSDLERRLDMLHAVQDITDHLKSETIPPDLQRLLAKHGFQIGSEMSETAKRFLDQIRIAAKEQAKTIRERN